MIRQYMQKVRDKGDGERMGGGNGRLLSLAGQC